MTAGLRPAQNRIIDRYCRMHLLNCRQCVKDIYITINSALARTANVWIRCKEINPRESHLRGRLLTGI